MVSLAPAPGALFWLSRPLVGFIFSNPSNGLYNLFLLHDHSQGCRNPHLRHPNGHFFGDCYAPREAYPCRQANLCPPVPRQCVQDEGRQCAALSNARWLASVDPLACFRPLSAWQLDNRSVVFYERPDGRALQISCGQCIGCRLERSRQWAVRCVHETQMHNSSAFVTLTYAPEKLTSISLVYRDFQLFMKRLRRAKGPVRFYMAGEYGESHHRPHFHAALFGVEFPDKQHWKDLPSGSRLYTSKELDSIWGLGFTSIGDVTFESAAYIARYCMKKVTGGPAADHYSAVDADTGEIVQRTPEFNRMSLKPGIGANWLIRYHADVYPRDSVRLRGVEMKPPKYYDRKWRSWDTFSFEAIQFSRITRGEQQWAENTPERLAVREAVTRAKLQFLKRSI